MIFDVPERKKPKLSREETLQIYIDIEAERTRIILEAKQSGKEKTLKDS